MITQRVISSRENFYDKLYCKYMTLIDYLDDGWEIISSAGCSDRVEHVLSKELPSDYMQSCCKAIVEHAQMHNVSGVYYCPKCGARVGIEGSEYKTFGYNGTYEVTILTLPVFKEEVKSNDK